MCNLNKVVLLVRGLCFRGCTTAVVFMVYLLCSCECRAIFTLANLTYSNARTNLSHVPKDIPAEAVNIYLHDNQIVTIHDDAFVDNVNCIKLRLDHNNLVTIKSSMWSGLDSLKWLDLSKNHIRHIENLAFIHLTELVGLYLSYNKLTTLREDIFATDFHPEKLTLHSNPLPQDDVTLCWIHQGVLEEWIAGFTLDEKTTIRCDEEGQDNKTGKNCCSSEDPEEFSSLFTERPDEQATDVPTVTSSASSDAPADTSVDKAGGQQQVLALLPWQIGVLTTVLIVTVITLCFCRKIRRNRARRRRDVMKNRPLPSPRTRRFLRAPPSPIPQESEDYLIPLEEPLTAFVDYSYPYQHQLVSSRGGQSPAPLEALQQERLLRSSQRPTAAAPADIPGQSAGTSGVLETLENWSPTQLQLQRPLLPLPSGYDAHAHSLRPTLHATQSHGTTPLYEEIYEGPPQHETTTV